MFDAHTNFAISAVEVAPIPAISGTVLSITAGTAAIFPTAPFNVTVWPSGTPTVETAEILRVTDITGDVFTVLRAQEGSSAVAIAVGYMIAATITVKTITDIQNAIVDSVTGENKSGSPVVAGTVLAAHPSGSGFILADSSATSKAAVGLALTDAAAAVSVEVLTNGIIELSDWTSITGSATLSPLGVYYLSATPGQLSLTASVTGISQLVGIAVSATQLELTYQAPILL